MQPQQCGTEYTRWDGVTSICQLEHTHLGDHYWTSPDGRQWTWWQGSPADDRRASAS